MREEDATGIQLDVKAEHRQVQATPEVAARLEIEPGDMCSEAVYTWHLDGEPVMISTQWEPLALTRGTEIESPASGDRGQPDVITRFAKIDIKVEKVREDVRDPDAEPRRGPHAQDPQRRAGLLHPTHSLRQCAC